MSTEPQAMAPAPVPPENGGTSNSRAVIVAAFIAAVGGIVIALINNKGGETTSLPATTTAETSVSSTPTQPPPPPGRREAYYATFSESSLDGTMVWPDTEPPRTAGEIKLDSVDAANPCKFSLRFEARDARGQLIDQQERSCTGSRTPWPGYGPVFFEDGTDVQQVDIIVVADKQDVDRIVCQRTDACRVL